MTISYNARYFVPMKKTKVTDFEKKNFISTLIFYQYIFLFGFTLLFLLMRSLIYIISYELGFVISMNFVQEISFMILKNTLFSMIFIIPLHFIVFVLYRYGYYDKLKLNPQEETLCWVTFSGFLTFLGFYYSISLPQNHKASLKFRDNNNNASYNFVEVLILLVFLIGIYISSKNTQNTTHSDDDKNNKIDRYKRMIKFAIKFIIIVSVMFGIN